jgi:hypothetical protein
MRFAKSWSILRCAWILSIVLMVTLSGCTMIDIRLTEDNEQIDKELFSGLVKSENDGWRQYYFDPDSIDYWTDSEGNEIVDVWVTIYYPDNLGEAISTMQKWHIDLSLTRYKISDNISYDKEGRICES